jgi:hypothetical protein
MRRDGRAGVILLRADGYSYAMANHLIDLTAPGFKGQRRRPPIVDSQEPE